MAAKEIYCHYRRVWLALGRARKRCPNCGGVIDATHQVRDAAATPATREKETRHG